ncbi:MAG: 4-hydroxy-3-methylbut-2-enyl diphosphate reductase [Bacteroidales bacterium]|jgi:4-hydroxy-3-methylbut-2-enyl diphosphate reductase|nr:4-hydroxy-3-methylbut-2-enyl diphosphate reductase [Bacteroidales bacterium]
MAISVEIDKQSGFCGGVIRAIDKAEKYLHENKDKKLYSLGAIVHNEAELKRLKEEGLVTVNYNDLPRIDGSNGKALLIRAHGEPKDTYDKAVAMGFDIIDCTCPVVLQLQKHIREAYARISSRNPEGQILIFGKIGHAEVIGLMSQAEGNAIVIENRKMLRDLMSSGKINLYGPIEIFSQTTKSPAEYVEICATLEEKMSKARELSIERFRGTGMLTIHNTICLQVASRHASLSDFAVSHDIIVFVSGKSSSNGKVLCDLCKSLNIRTYHICSPEEIRKEWFRDDDRVGVCGATSTPKWLLHKVADTILEYNSPESSYGPGQLRPACYGQADSAKA